MDSLTEYKWQVVAKNIIGDTPGPVWTFTTVDRRDISNATTPAQPEWPDGGVDIDAVVGIGDTGRLVGTTQTIWWSGGFSVDLNLNGNTLILDTGNGNYHNDSGAIFGAGEVRLQGPALNVTGGTGNTYTGTTTVSSAATLGKSSGNALCGTITMHDGSYLEWAASNQINDTSDVTLLGTASLNLAGFSDTIASLTLAAGSSVATGDGGVLTVSSLTVGGTVQPSGTYTSSSGFVTGSGSIVVGAAGTPYEIWAAANAGGQTPGEDSNHDGVQNGIAYFMGMNGLATNPGVVNGKVTWPNGGNIPSSAYGTQFVVQTSTDLVNWADVLVGDSNLNNTSGSVSYTLPTGDAKEFCRLSVTP